MTEIDAIENKLFLTKDAINFGEAIDDFLSEEYSGEEIDKLEFRKDKAEELLYRFNTIYGLDILTPENGYSLLNVIKKDEELKDDAFLIKRYLHRFLIHKSKMGGTGASSDRSGKLFEAISAQAVKNFLGEGSKIILTGEADDCLSTERLKEIAKVLHEKEGKHHNLPQRAKDDGVDFIVYKPVDDRNVGNLIVLGQSSVGKNYIRKKVIHERWQSEYIPFAVRPPTKVLSVVAYLEEDKLRQAHSDFGNAIVFDRGRIMKYFNTEDTGLNESIIHFVKNNIIENE